MTTICQLARKDNKYTHKPDMFNYNNQSHDNN